MTVIQECVREISFPSENIFHVESRFWAGRCNVVLIPSSGEVVDNLGRHDESKGEDHHENVHKEQPADELEVRGNTGSEMTLDCLKWAVPQLERVDQIIQRSLQLEGKLDDNTTVSIQSEICHLWELDA